MDKCYICKGHVHLSSCEWGAYDCRKTVSLCRQCHHKLARQEDHARVPHLDRVAILEVICC